MSQQSEDDARRRNRRRLIPFGVCFFFGLTASFKAIGNPRLATLTGADVLGLIAIGLCFGVALAGFMRFFVAALTSRQPPHESTEVELARLKERIAELEQRGQKRTS
jgi:hypothetical protein